VIEWRLRLGLNQTPVVSGRTVAKAEDAYRSRGLLETSSPPTWGRECAANALFAVSCELVALARGGSLCRPSLRSVPSHNNPQYPLYGSIRPFQRRGISKLAYCSAANQRGRELSRPCERDNLR
jgi:hypothetical protein